MMKRYLFVLALSLFALGNAEAQEKGQLFRFDEATFEIIAKEKLKDTDLSPLVVVWAKDVFRSYCNEKGIKADFSDEDYQRAMDSLDFYAKQYLMVKKEKETSEEELVKLMETQNQLENDFLALKETDKATIDELEARIVAYSSIDAVIAQKTDSLRLLNDSVKQLNEDVKNWKNTSSFLNETINSLVVDTARMNKELVEVRGENIGLKSSLAEKEADNEAKSKEIEELKNENNALAETNERFRQTFATTENTINTIYNENKAKPILDMDAVQLGAAKSAFDGMRPLLAIDASKLAELEGNVNEMNEWAQLNGLLNEASGYLKGKYDDKQRRSMIAKLDKVAVKSSKAINDKNDMLDLLQNEDKLKENFDNIIYNLNEMKCLPDEKALGKALNMLNQMKGFVAKYHRDNVYESYDRAIDMIENELKKTEPSDDVITAVDFKKFLEKLKIMF